MKFTNLQAHLAMLTQTQKAALTQRPKCDFLLPWDQLMCVNRRTTRSLHTAVPQGRRKWQPTPVVLPRESHGQRSLVGCCPQGHTESATTEVTQHTCMHWRREWQPTPVFLPGESQGQRSLVGCRLWGCTELDTTEATQQQQEGQGHLLILWGNQREEPTLESAGHVYSFMKTGPRPFYHQKEHMF